VKLFLALTSIIGLATASLAVGQDDLDRWFKARAESFQLLPEFSRGIQACDKIALYEGLPHQLMEKEAFTREMARKKTIEIGGHRFYASPVVISNVTAAKLKRLYTAKGSFSATWGIKYCGGFHPDWCIQWMQGRAVWTVHLCFGCGEMMTSHNGKSLEADFRSEKVEEKFKAILAPYQKERPPYSPLRRPFSQK
jgi:hypothetical protein